MSSKITKNMTHKQLALLVSGELKRRGIDVVLVGGAVVSIYSENKYWSKDLDFISPADHQRIAEAMMALGFERDTNRRSFFHPKTALTVEFPGSTLNLGNEKNVKAEGEVREGKETLRLLSPTQCVYDRLLWFYTCRDRQALEQAFMVMDKHPVNLDEIRERSENERFAAEYQKFLTERRLWQRKHGGGQ